MTKLKRHIYHVIFDSSSLYGEPIAKQVVELIEQYANDDRVGIKVYIPAIVEKELERKVLEDIFSKHKQVRKSLKTLKLFFPELQLDLPETITEEDVVSAKDRILRNLDIEVIPSPVDKIDWLDIIDRATRYQIPFEVAHEKGFKDCIIAETAISHFLDSKRVGVYAFVCGDEKLAAYMRQKTETHSKFNVFESVPALDTDIRLRLDESTKKIVDRLLSDASGSFYSDSGKSTLFNFSSLSKRIGHEVGELIKTGEFNQRYSSIRAGTYGPIQNIEIAKPIFKSRPTKTTFTWQTNIIAETDLVNDRPTVTPGLPRLKIEFRVDWTASFTKRGEIKPREIKMDDFRTSSYDVDLPVIKVDNIGLEGYMKKFTTFGQPTFPVSHIQQINNFQGKLPTVSGQLRESLRKLQGLQSNQLGLSQLEAMKKRLQDLTGDKEQHS